MAIDGRTGEQLWIRYTPHELFASNCNNDINGDAIKDCILGGRMAVSSLQSPLMITVVTQIMPFVDSLCN